MSYQNRHLQDFRGKRIGVLGLGVSGISALELLGRLESRLVAVNSGEKEKWLPRLENQLKITWEKNPHFFSQDDPQAGKALADCEVIVLSPGIPRDVEVLQMAREKGIPVISEIELGALFLEEERIIAVTGTNGKTTVVSLLSYLLEELHIPHFSGGNIGTPLCEYIKSKLEGTGPKDVVALEISSFQMESTSLLKPNRCVVTNIFDNHSERYASVEEYFAAKWTLAEKTLGSGGKVLAGENCRSFLGQEQLDQKQEDLNFLSSQDSKLFEWLQYYKVRSDLFSLPGNHNRQNLVFALWCLEELFNREEWELNLSLILGALTTFRGPEHRLEFLPSGHSFEIFNDAKSTNWQATFAALKALREKSRPIWLIVGGQWRGADADLHPELEQLQKKEIEKVYLFGEVGAKLKEGLSKISAEVVCFPTLDEVWRDIKTQSFSGVVLFSPAFPSFDQFQNYRERGEHFKSLIRE